MISIIIPANNEEGYIGDCLGHVLASHDPVATRPAPAPPLQVVVVANGCSDETVGEALATKQDFAARGWRLDVLDLAEGGKVRALNAGDAAAIHPGRIYVDADVHVSPGLIAGLVAVLDRPEAAYASGSPGIRTAQSAFSERYARFWEKLPFMTTGAPGCGVYAVNGAGRARWQEFPDVIADDTFVRYQFDPHEMHRVSDGFTWPITEGFTNLVRVRRRQDRGLQDIRDLLPERVGKMAPPKPELRQKLALLRRDPLGFMCYTLVFLSVRSGFFDGAETWARGR